MLSGMGNSNYRALTDWARPCDMKDDPRPGIKVSSPFCNVSFAFDQNIERIRTLAVLPGVAAAHAIGPKTDLNAGAEQVEASQLTPWVMTGTEVLYASVLIGAWTAFEVLAGDLWVETVNRFPLLGVRALDAEPLPDDTDTQREMRAKKKIQFVAQRFLDPDFDPKGKVGDALRELFPMGSFGKIITGYVAIFRDDGANKIIRDKSIRSLSAVRNALVHNAGKADEDFLPLVKNDDRFSGIKVGDPIKLDGAVTAALLESVRTQGYKLIKFVDGWCDDTARSKASRNS
jgi:hypothetical protein